MGCGNPMLKRRKSTQVCIMKPQINDAWSTTSNSSRLEDYSISTLLGKGGFGKVVKAQHVSTKAQFAIKMIAKNPSKPNQSKKALNNEVSVLKKLNHENIVSYIDSFEDSSFLYIVTELCQEKNLYEKIKKAGKLKENTVKEILLQILSAVEYLHDNKIVHRDIKLENILFVSEGSNKIKLTDFGTAANLEKNQRVSGCCGSIFYIAPEMLEGDYNEKIDIWSCGILAYALSTGKWPYEERTTEEVLEKILCSPFQISADNCEGLSNEFVSLLKEMLRIKPEERISASDAIRHKLFNDVILFYFMLNYELVTCLKKLSLFFLRMI
ncbi:hypothetical protein SteCoe_26745 [Stentor coeruleus]|uniref:non-specific serine/threonine protein kinase n=1 Tax=Stentor coeruleus TaxID=5963 RepID=A0A1R2BC61_9CILI|nr:hypothetical protein SteCoe_26745 [Stentor coeruleus]